MNFNMDVFKGAWSAMSTPLTEEGKVDSDALYKLIEHQLKLGIKGLFLAGTAGEGPFLPDRERLRLAELTMRYTAGRIPIAMQITDNSAERMIENLERYQELIDIAVIAPPFFQRDANDDFLVDLYNQVIEASKIPVGIYNRGKYSSVYITPEVLSRILDNPKVILCKDSASMPEFTAAIMEVKKRRNGELAVLCGDEFNCVEYLKQGYDGVLFGGGCFNGAYAAEMCRLAAAGEYARAQKIQDHLAEVMYKVFGGKNIECWLAGQKELMVRLNVFNTAKTFLSYQLTEECSRMIDEVIRDEKSWLLK
ncbi:MAG: dihydrodipicolinate synthase family protein [Lentisphaeria bacterium]|nr:dihydrodipicolinate synthase family protein [Lentisphaeria bacterium]MBR7143606.1 dihydrodipicolinate synthase family protein [Lentisphaeria bacterium]